MSDVYQMSDIPTRIIKEILDVLPPPASPLPSPHPCLLFDSVNDSRYQSNFSQKNLETIKRVIAPSAFCEIHQNSLRKSYVNKYKNFLKNFLEISNRFSKRISRTKMFSRYD